MTKTTRARYTLEFKQEAVRLVEGGQSQASVARSLGVADQTLFNWVKASRQGALKGADRTPVSAEQTEISRLRAELARVKMERDILEKGEPKSRTSCECPAGRTRTSPRVQTRVQSKVRLYSASLHSVADQRAMSGAQRQRQRLPWASGSPSEYCTASIPE